MKRISKTGKIYIAGHTGMVGSAIHRQLKKEGYTQFLLRTHKELELTDQAAVRDFFADQRPDYVFLAAAKVGGIMANNTLRAEFIYSNLAIQNNIIHSSHEFGVKKLLFLGSSCIYPRDASQPLREEYLLTGPLEPTNEPYAIAKIAGIKMCEAYRDQYGDNFISVMPTNLYGPNDTFDLEYAHVLPALIHRVHLAKVNNLPHVKVWGSGNPRREFMHVDDMARAVVHLMHYYDGKEFINIGVGKDVSIKELAEKICKVVGYTGAIRFDTSKPDGMPRKLMDVDTLRQAGFTPEITLDEGLRSTYEYFLDTHT